MAHDESVSDSQHPLPDLAYDWVVVVKNKADALLAYHKYMQDAQAANSQECAAMFRKLYDEDSRLLMEAKRHLGEVLAGRMGQGQAQRQSSGQGMGQSSSQQAQSMGKSSSGQSR
jgi:hypothetical protein